MPSSRSKAINPSANELTALIKMQVIISDIWPEYLLQLYKLKMTGLYILGENITVTCSDKILWHNLPAKHDSLLSHFSSVI